MKIGDDVLYVPDACHAMEENPAGDFVWAIGRKSTRRTPEGIKEVVEELKGKTLKDFLNAAKRQVADRSKIVLIRPAVFWPAKVSGLNNDGTVNLDIQAGRGVTLHYSDIEIDEKKNTPHTCHAIKVESVAPAAAPIDPTPFIHEE